MLKYKIKLRNFIKLHLVIINCMYRFFLLTPNLFYLNYLIQIAIYVGTGVALFLNPKFLDDNLIFYFGTFHIII